MDVRLSAHGAYHHEFHIVWIPKYRKRILKNKLKDFIEKRLYDIQEYHPDVEIERYSIQLDHVHLVIVIPPKYSVSAIVGKIKANTSREVRKRFWRVSELSTPKQVKVEASFHAAFFHSIWLTDSRFTFSRCKRAMRFLSDLAFKISSAWPVCFCSGVT